MKKLNIILSTTFIIAFCLSSMVLLSCKEKEPEIIDKPIVDKPTFKEPVDPPIAPTMGFFLNEWQAKTYVAPAYTETVITTSAPTTIITVDASNVLTKIPLTIFGHNANNWMTRMYNEPIFIKHLTNLKPNIIRWPAGSGSDCHFWNCNQDQQVL